jgi:putative DNA methylase
MYKKKLIEVALPLEAINKESLHRKQKAPKGWPTSFHKWWAQRPLASARAMIFAQMVDDPTEYVDVLRANSKLRRKAEFALKARLKLWEEARSLAEKAKGTSLSVPEPGPAPTLDDMLADLERQRLFKIIEDFVLWENTNNESVLEAARAEIWQSWRRACAENADHPRAKELFNRHQLPAFCDPFSGSGSLPLSAQWFGLEAYASDLNPVAVLINKAMIEIPPRFAGQPPVNPKSRDDAASGGSWKGATGLAEDVRYYGQWMREEAEKRIGHLYPKIEVTSEMAKSRSDLKPYVGKKLTVIAWLWARTVKSPNPAFGQVDVPLASTFMLSSKAGKEAYVEPLIEDGGYRFTVKVGKPKNIEAARNGTSAGKRKAFKCLVSGVPIGYDYIRAEAKSGRMGERLMTMVAEGERGRVFLSPTPEMETLARKAVPDWKPDCEMPKKHRDFKPPVYGMNNLGDIFTNRQLVALTTFSNLVQEARERVKRDALAANLPDDDKPLATNGTGAAAYADAICTYLACVLDRMVYYGSSLTSWLPKDNALRDCMPRQVLAMTWDFAECNPLGKSSGDVLTCTNSVSNYLDVATPQANGFATQRDAQTALAGGKVFVFSTDPPYYDNISYADLSDFFYVWLRRSLKPVFSDLFATLAVPKVEELVASPHRHGSKEKAETFFLGGMTKAMHRLAEQAHPAFPVTIYYAFKQSESDDAEGTTNTGWDTFLDAVVRAGFAITGTWPMRTEGAGRMIASGTNALASSIVLVCRPRAVDAPTATRREFVTALKSELPAALAHLQHGNIAPVDLAQAAIGPGMAVYTRYAKVLDAEGKPLSVREALALINQTLDEALAEQEGDFDADSRWALTWFEQTGFSEGEYGMAEQLSKSKNTAVAGLAEAGIVVSSRGKVRLLKPRELPADWDPLTDPRLTAWETVHHLIRILEAGGENAAAKIVAKLGANAETARELCYRLYALCERKKRASEALSYNALVQSWPEITRLARETSEAAPPTTDDLFK